ncbi:MAG TPA: hypothetical protein VGH60_07940 [Solirubrobacteraceae bacterium]
MNATTIVAVFALVFAMTGGAYAAKKYLITSTKQISPSVLKALQGKAGAAGAAGAQGAAGVQGPAGPAGPQGPAGNGGTKGERGAEGKEGATGKEGSPWTAGGKLPSKKTETGAWSATAGPFDAGINASLAAASISFTIPLAHVPQVKIEPEEYEGSEAECPSTTKELEEGLVAKALPGVLCVYPYKNSALEIAAELKTLFVSVNGAALQSKVEEIEAGSVAYGIWAVTAE